MTDKTIATIPRLAFSTDAGGPASGYLLYTYETGGAVPATTWANQAGTIANANPIVLDARGECTLWLTAVQEYRLVLKTPAGTTEWTEDDVSGAQSAAVVVPVALTSQTGHSSALITNGLEATWLDSGLNERNRIVNGSFSVNRYALASPIIKTVGLAGHDNWVAGAAGVQYSFGASSGLTTITITAGTLVQTITAADVPTGTNTCTLSWFGTAQGRVAGGAFHDSPITVSVSGGAALPIEFGIGTLTKVQFEVGAVATPYLQRHIAAEMLLVIGYDTVPLRYIEGALVSVTGDAAISVSVGSARLLDGTILQWLTPLTLSGITVGASTIYHVYVNAGTGSGPALECVTTAPATPYEGTARSKTGAPGSRYLGSVRSDASSHLYRQQHGTGNRVRYLVPNVALVALSFGTQTSLTDVSLTAFIPITAVAAMVFVVNTNTTYAGYVSDSGSGYDMEVVYKAGSGLTATLLCTIPCDSSQNISYRIDGAAPGLSIYVHGYDFER